MKRLIVTLVALAFAGEALAQNRPRPFDRPPWQDVCCGGPCCAKPGRRY